MVVIMCCISVMAVFRLHKLSEPACRENFQRLFFHTLWLEGDDTNLEFWEPRTYILYFQNVFPKIAENSDLQELIPPPSGLVVVIISGGK